MRIAVQPSGDGQHQKDAHAALLYEAARDNDLPKAEQMLSMGVEADVSVYHTTPCHIACERGNVEALQLLISGGADVNKRGYLEETMLMAAAHRGRKECVVLLLSKEADAMAKNGHEESADTLVEQRMKQIIGY